ncbi:MAG: hypothetical protein KGQ46_02275 [Hyphomicrobiales bacterium]|nr:hypothetical protein [Hyphomicrobiales bacterium]MDE2114774.1 hypothetical protein [Hyphomicrobiales bacterium]
MTIADLPTPPQSAPNDDARIKQHRRAAFDDMEDWRKVPAAATQVLVDAAPDDREAVDDDGEPSVILEGEYPWLNGPNLDIGTYSGQIASSIRRDIAAGILEPRHIEYAEEIESAAKEGDTVVVALVEERFRADKVASLVKQKAKQEALNFRRAVPLKDATARRVTDTDKIKKLFVEHDTLKGVLTALETAMASGGYLFDDPRASALRDQLTQVPYANAMKYFRGRRDEARRQPRNKK